MTTELADLIKLIRGEKSLREVESKTGISNAYLSQLERGLANNPSPDVLFKLSKCFSYPYDQLMRAAGYLQKPKGTPSKTDAMQEAQIALMSSGLSAEEVSKVMEYVDLLRSTHEKPKRRAGSGG